jgi:hypothetical protein
MAAKAMAFFSFQEDRNDYCDEKSGDGEANRGCDPLD